MSVAINILEYLSLSHEEQGDRGLVLKHRALLSTVNLDLLPDVLEKGI